RKWRAVAFATAGVAAGVFVTVAALGLTQTLSFVHGASWLTDDYLVKRVDNLSLGPFVSRTFWALTRTASGSSADWIRRASIAVADLIVLGLTIRTTLADENRGDPDWRIYSLWIATAIMLSPVGWHHYLVLLTIPFVQLVTSAAQGRAGHLDGGVGLSSERGFAHRLQPLAGAAAHRVPAQLPMVGARARGSELRRLTDRVYRGLLVRDRSRAPSSRDTSNDRIRAGSERDLLEAEHLPQLHRAEPQHRFVADPDNWNRAK